jgi:hypothetical protein
MAVSTENAIRDIERTILHVEGELTRVLQTVTALTPNAGPSVIFDFVFAPGHPMPLPANVFTTWPDLVTAANQIGGMPYITFDDSFSPVVIPAGMWSFSGRPAFRALPARANIGPPVTVTVADGARIAGVCEFRDLDIHSLSSSPVISSPQGSAAAYFLQGAASLQADGTAPFIEHGVSQQCLLVVDDSANVLSGKLKSPALNVTVAGEPFTAITWKSGFIQGDTIKGVPGRSYGARIAQPDGMIEAQPNAPGFTIAFGAQPQFIQYVPANVKWPKPAPTNVHDAIEHVMHYVPTKANWTAPAPANVHEAIERLATALVARTGGAPIP